MLPCRNATILILESDFPKFKKTFVRRGSLFIELSRHQLASISALISNQ
jgi:hypothetical protein